MPRSAETLIETPGKAFDETPGKALNAVSFEHSWTLIGASNNDGAGDSGGPGDLPSMLIALQDNFNEDYDVVLEGTLGLGDYSSPSEIGLFGAVTLAASGWFITDRTLTSWTLQRGKGFGIFNGSGYLFADAPANPAVTRNGMYFLCNVPARSTPFGGFVPYAEWDVPVGGSWSVHNDDGAGNIYPVYNCNGGPVVNPQKGALYFPPQDVILPGPGSASTHDAALQLTEPENNADNLGDVPYFSLILWFGQNPSVVPTLVVANPGAPFSVAPTFGIGGRNFFTVY